MRTLLTQEKNAKIKDRCPNMKRNVAKNYNNRTFLKDKALLFASEANDNRRKRKTTTPDWIVKEEETEKRGDALLNMS